MPKRMKHQKGVEPQSLCSYWGGIADGSDASEEYLDGLHTIHITSLDDEGRVVFHFYEFSEDWRGKECYLYVGDGYAEEEW